MYQVIARKYRPQTFADVIGQEHVKTTLENAIAQTRIAHGYIFSGQRGTGKTTMARILARCLNCINGPTNQPCGECASCREIAGGGAVDVIEVDAASNRGINEIRELRENVRYRPARDRFKVFIIDEAHQITPEAFNALLKTLEEPPSWVVFVLCTTEAHKIPATIASRCQHFSFRSVEFRELVERMEWICREENVEADQECLALLAQSGEGSVRDSLSSLDQAIACCGGKLTAEEVRRLLGAFALQLLEGVTDALSESNSARMLDIVDELERNGHNLQHFSRELSRYFRNLLVARIAGPDTRLIGASPAQRERLAAIAGRFSEEDLTRYLHLTLELFKDLQSSLQPRFHLEIGLVRLVQAGKLMKIEDALAALGDGEPTLQARAETREFAPPRAPVSRPAPAPPPSRSGPSPFEQDRARKTSREPLASAGGTAVAMAEESPPVAGAPADNAQWRERIHAALVDLGMNFTADGVEHSSVSVNGDEVLFTTSAEFKLSMTVPDLDQAVRKVAGRPMRVKVTLSEGAVEPQAPIARAQQKDDVETRALDHPEVKRFLELFGGEVRHVRNLKE
jgi:DNA polymerase-3 subunit gamma/tau